MAEDTLDLSRNPLWNDASILFMVAIFVGGFYFFIHRQFNIKDIIRRVELLCYVGSYISSCVKSVCLARSNISGSIESVCHIRSNISGSVESVCHARSNISRSVESVCHARSNISGSEESVCHARSNISGSVESVCHARSNIPRSVESLCHGGSNISDRVESVYHAGSYISRSVEPVCHTGCDTRSVEQSKNKHFFSDTIVLNGCIEINQQRPLPTHNALNPLTRQQDPIVTDWGSNLRRLNNFNYKKSNCKGKTSVCGLQNTNDRLPQKQNLWEALFAGQIPRLENNIIVYPARQRDHENNPQSRSEVSETTNNPLDVEGDEHVINDGNLPPGISTNDSDSRPVTSSDVLNQRTEETAVLRQDSEISNEINCHEQACGTGFNRPNDPEYELLAKRQQTYLKWPNRLQGKEKDLVAAGFFFTGIRDCTRCFWCGGEIEQWQAGDDPWIEHARWFPNCSFIIQKKQQSFVDLVQDSRRHQKDEFFSQLTPHQQRQVRRKQNKQMQQGERHNLTAERHTSNRMAVLQVSEDPTRNRYSDARDRIVFPRFPEHAQLVSRSNTFRKADCVYNPQVAEAGFFYRAPGLIVCFHCGGHLYAWKPGDNFWIEHARWFPNCAFVKANRGDNFVENVQRRVEENLDVQMSNTTFPQYPHNISLQTRRHNNLETSNPQSPSSPRHINPQSPPSLRHISSQACFVDNTDQDNFAEDVFPIHQPNSRLSVTQDQHQRIPSSAQAQHEPTPSVAPSQHQLIPSVVQAQHQQISSMAQAQHQRIPSSAQAQHEAIPSVAPSQHQLIPSVVQAQHQQISSMAQAQHQRIPSVAQAQHEQLPSVLNQQPRPPISHNRQHSIPFMAETQSFGIQAQENPIVLSQSVIVENGSIHLLRNNVISNRMTEHINRRVYAPRVTRVTRTGQVVENYQWNLICRKCQERAVNVTFVPCGHRVCCEQCGRGERECPICHKIIDGIEQ